MENCPPKAQHGPLGSTADDRYARRVRQKDRSTLRLSRTRIRALSAPRSCCERNAAAESPLDAAPTTARSYGFSGISRGPGLGQERCRQRGLLRHFK